nr:wax ester/triacylglycerol synthase family O-acyltransferase [Rhabdothermincola salaria]
MGPADAVLWDIEDDPVLRSTIVAVALLDRPPDWERLRDRLDRVSCRIPRLRERVVDPPLGLGPPRWVVDDDFDLIYHLRRVRCPAPGDIRAVLDLAQPAAMAAFDRSRPLWEFTVVEDLADGRAALIQKLHHSVTDGVGGVELALLLLDDGPDAMPPPDRPAPRPRSASSLAELSLYAAGERLAALVGAARALPAFARDTLPHLGEVAPSLGRLVRPVSQPASPLMRGRSLARRLHVMEVPLDELRAAGHAVGGTANDAYLAAVIGGLARYHVHHAVALDELRVTMPINARRAGDDMVGNRFTPARFSVPADIDDPAERIRRLGELARRWRNEPANAFTDAVAAALDALPRPVTTAVMGSMLRNIDLVCSNVPGLPGRAWLAGAEVQRQFAFAPPGGSALSVTLMSHIGIACVGIATDGVAVPDPDRLQQALVEEFAAVLALADPL